MHATALAATSGARHWRPPSFSTRFYPVWQRNLLVWRKLAVASVLGNIADPLLYMLALGYGIGALIGEVGGMPYVAFIGTGMVCQSAMFTASFEGMYSAFSRMHVQRTWDAIINAPIALDDVMLAEWMWCATKALMSTIAILLVLMALGYGRTPLALCDPADRLPHRARVRRVRAGDERARAGLRLLHVLLHAGADADAAPLRRLLPGRAAAGVARRRRRDPAAQARDRPGAAADARSHPGRDPAARRRAGWPTRSPRTTSRWCSPGAGCSSSRCLRLRIPAHDRALLRPLPARARGAPRRRARRARRRRHRPDRRWRRLRGTARARLPREPRVAPREPHPVARRRRPLPRRARRPRARQGRPLADPLPRRPHAARRRGRDALAAHEPRVRDADGEGRGLRPLPRRHGWAAVGGQARSRRARARAPDRATPPRSTSTPRASRCSSAAGAATPRRRRCARISRRGCWRSPDGGPACRCSTRCAAAARSRSRRRSSRRTAHRGSRAPSASRSSRGTTAPRGSGCGRRPRTASSRRRNGDGLRERQRGRRGREVRGQCEGRQGRRVRRRRARRRPRARGTGTRGRPRVEPALRRAPVRP